MSFRHKLLHLTSRHQDVITSSSNSDFIVSTGNYYGLHDVKRVVLKQATIPNVFYNINENNRSFTYNIATVPTTVQVPVGQYSLTELIAALVIALAGVGFGATQDALTSKIDFTTTTAIEYLTESQGNAMGAVLGIADGSGADVLAHTASGIPILDGVRNLAIQSNILGESNLISGESKMKNILAIIPVDVPYAGVVSYVSERFDNYDALDQSHGKNIANIDIKLIDLSTGLIADIQNHHVDLIVKIFY